MAKSRGNEIGVRCILAFVALSWLSVTAAPADAETFDAVSGFSSVSNPTSIWSYNYSLDGVTNGIVLLPTYGFANNDNEEISDGTHIFPFKVWRLPSLNGDSQDAWLSISANKTALNWTFVSSNAIVPAHHLFVHPPRSGDVILTFTAPRTMSGMVNYSFTHIGCENGTSGVIFTVQQIRQAIYRPFVATIDQGLLGLNCNSLPTSGNRSMPIALEAGDQVNFIVRPNAANDNFSDATTMTASITAH